MISEVLLTCSVVGVNHSPGTLADQLESDLTLLVFLRQFGCMFCRETLSDMRAISESNARLLDPFFFQGSPTEGRAFLRRYWPGLRAVADPSSVFYRCFGIKRGGAIKALGPAVWAAKPRANAKGHRNGPVSGDIWRTPGVFLVQAKEILWAHQYRHVADHPDYQQICEVSESVSTGARP